MAVRLQNAQGEVVIPLDVNEPSGTASVLWLWFLDAVSQAVPFGAN